MAYTVFGRRERRRFRCEVFWIGPCQWLKVKPMWAYWPGNQSLQAAASAIIDLLRSLLGKEVEIVWTYSTTINQGALG